VKRTIVDWVRVLGHIIQSGIGWYWDDDGIFRKIGNSQPWNHGWRFSPVRIPDIKRDCLYQHMIFFAAISKTGTVPEFCRGCWKVVMALPTLRHVQLVERWQQEGSASKWACKVGSDHRPYTRHLWGAYFYCRGKEEGLERLDQVREWMYENMPGVPVYLKRGCTEFEAEIGDSALWDNDSAIAEADAIEAEANEYIDPGPLLKQQPEHMVTGVHSDWVAWHGMTRPHTTYEEPVESILDLEAIREREYKDQAAQDLADHDQRIAEELEYRLGEK